MNYVSIVLYMSDKFIGYLYGYGKTGVKTGVLDFITLEKQKGSYTIFSDIRFL